LQITAESTFNSTSDVLCYNISVTNDLRLASAAQSDYANQISGHTHPQCLSVTGVTTDDAVIIVITV